MWLFIDPLAIMKRMWPPPAPRSFASFSGRFTASATKLVLSSSLALVLVGEVVGLSVEAPRKSCGVLKTNSGSSYRLMIGGMFVEEDEAGRGPPEPLKCWCQALSGIAKSEPGPPLKVTLAPASFQTEVEPCPDKTRIISSKSWRCGASSPAAGISHT